MESDPKHLKEILEKVVLFTEADDSKSLNSAIVERFVGIPRNNKKSYLHGLIGFIYEGSDSTDWVITQAAFEAKCIQLTTDYRLKQFTLPPFTGRNASEEELASHEDKLFVQKIQMIEYEEVIPEAVGNWIELHNSLNEELDGAPQFRTTTNQYQRQLVAQYRRRYSRANRSRSNAITDSKNLYDEVIGESPGPIQEYPNPPLEYKNGLIHDAMDDEGENLQWRVEPCPA